MGATLWGICVYLSSHPSPTHPFTHPPTHPLPQAASVRAMRNVTQKLTHPGYGLLWSEPNQWWQPTRADVTLNAWGRFVVTEAGAAPSGNSVSGKSQMWGQ